MSGRLTRYERLVTILTREQKIKVVRYCDKNKYSAAQVMRDALRLWFKEKGIDL
jgi:hypothetical protein